MKTLTDRTALVTGGTSGIGLAVAKALAAQGANVMLDGFGETDACEALAAELAQAHGVKAAWTGADVSKPEQLANAVDRAEREARARRHPRQQRRLGNVARVETSRRAVGPQTRIH